MKLLQHKAKDHSKQEQVEMKDIKLQDYKDTLDKHIENNKKTCNHCAILQHDNRLKIGPS